MKKNRKCRRITEEEEKLVAERLRGGSLGEEEEKKMR